MLPVLDTCPTCACVHAGSQGLEGSVILVSAGGPDCGCVCHGRRERNTWRRVLVPAQAGPTRVIDLHDHAA